MFRFIVPLAYGNVFQVTIEADSLQAAFAEYAAKYWRFEYDPAVAVWDRCFLVAKVLSRYNFEEREFEAVLQEIPPPTGGA